MSTAPGRIDRTSGAIIAGFMTAGVSTLLLFRSFVVETVQGQAQQMLAFHFLENLETDPGIGGGVLNLFGAEYSIPPV